MEELRYMESKCHDREIIMDGRSAAELAERAFEALLAWNCPAEVFCSQGLPVRVHGKPARVHVLDQSEMRGLLEYCATWMGRGKKGQTFIAGVRSEIVNAMFAARPWHHLPALVGVTRAPMMNAYGDVLAVHGYDPFTRRFYDLAGLDVRQMTEDVTEAELKEAVRLLSTELLGDFPFVDDSSRANALALILTPFAMELIDGEPWSPRRVPMFLVDAPAPGTGKSLLVEACVSITDPRSAAAVSAPREAEEFRKLVTGLLMEGSSHVVLDNIGHRLDSGELAVVLTTGVWKSRILGVSDVTSLESRAVWVATGNNLQASDEVVDRSIWIRMDAKTEFPSGRGGFRHADLMGFVSRERSALVRSVLVLLRWWHQNGRPKAEVQWRTFTPWAQTVGGILMTAGVYGFLGNRQAMRARADADTAMWLELFETWRSLYGTQPVGVSQLFQAIDGQDLRVEERLGDKGTQSQKVRLGRMLRSQEGRIYGGYRLVRSGEFNRAMLYCLEPVEAQADGRLPGELSVV